MCTAQNINPTLMVLKAMKKSCEPKAEGKKKEEILLLIRLFCCETNNREKAVRLSIHIQLPIPPSQKKEKRMTRLCANPASHFPLFKFCIHTIKGIDSKDTFNFVCEVRKEWHCLCYSFSLKHLLSTPTGSP